VARIVDGYHTLLDWFGIITHQSGFNTLQTTVVRKGSTRRKRTYFSKFPVTIRSRISWNTFEHDNGGTMDKKTSWHWHFSGSHLLHPPVLYMQLNNFKKLFMIQVKKEQTLFELIVKI